MNIRKLLIFFIWICVISSVFSIPNSTGFRKPTRNINKRSKRTFFYNYTFFPWLPYNTCVAFAVVLAIPLNLKGRNVYMSYNFETNFYMPYFDKKQGLVPLPFAKIDAAAVNSGTFAFYENGGETRKLNGNEEEIDAIQNGTNIEHIESLKSTNPTEKTIVIDNVSFRKTNSTKSPHKKHHKKSKQDIKKEKKTRVNREILTTLLSRKKLYKMFEHKLDIAGFNGEECLLKAICETADQPLAEHNGVLGDIMQVMFTPTASRDEKLPRRYYDAISDGQSGNCRYYNTLCPKGIFDFITKTIK